jgi:hypothetical protein
MRARYAVLAAALFLLSAGAAKANIIFCNKSGYDLIYIAIAYPQSDGSFLSRGWMSVTQGNSANFDTALHVKSLYFRGESKWVRHGRRREREIWGKGYKFAVWDNDNFQYYGAQDRVLKSTLEDFSMAGEAADGDLSVTVTFTDQGSTISTTSRSQAAPAPEPSPTPTPEPPKLPDPKDSTQKEPH